MRLFLSSNAALGLLVAVLAAQTTHSVPGSFPTIQSAIMAAQSGDMITVAPGVYVENIDFLGKAITVSGSGAGGCVINGGGQPVIVFNSGETRASVLEGFTILNGRGDPLTANLFGGGINVIDASPTLRDLEVRNCTGAVSPSMVVPLLPPGAGGIYLARSAALVERCTVHHCFATQGGPHPGAGGIEVYGGAPTIRDCDVFGNTGGTPLAFNGLASAGGIGFSAGTVALVTRTRIRGNQGGWSVGFSVSTGAGGIQVTSGSWPVIDQCVIVDNVAGSYAPAPTGEPGALTIGGAAVYVRNAKAVFVNCVIRGNEAPAPPPTFLTPLLVAFRASGPDVALVNCIVRDDLVDFEFSPGSGMTFRHNNTHGSLPGPGNFDADPDWVDPDAGDFHLMPSSPCIDAGDPSLPVPTLLDYDGDLRDSGLAIDVGVDEFGRGCRLGDVDDGAGSFVPVLDIDGETVAAVVPVAAPFALSVSDPPQNPGALFAIFAFVGVPNLDTITPLPFGLGDFCFGGGPQTLLLTTNFSVTPDALVPSTPTPWTLSLAGIPVPLDLAFQGIILETSTELAVTNLVQLRIGIEPPPVITSVAPIAPTPGDPVTVTGTGFHPSAIVSIDGVPVGNPTISATSISFTAGPVACGANLTVTNPDQQSHTTEWNVAAVIASTNVGSGPAAGGNTFLLYGRFAPGTALTIGGQTASPYYQTDSLLITLMPAGSPGPVAVVVTAPNGCTDQVVYTYL